MYGKESYQQRPDRPSKQTPWDILGIPEGADPETVKKAYRSLAKELHPDRGGSDEAIKRLNNAKDALDLHFKSGGQSINKETRAPKQPERNEANDYNFSAEIAKHLPLFSVGDQIYIPTPDGDYDPNWFISSIDYGTRTYRILNKSGTLTKPARFDGLEAFQKERRNPLLQKARYAPGTEVVVPRSDGKMDLRGWTVVQLATVYGTSGYMVENTKLGATKFLDKDILERAQHFRNY